MNQLCQLRTWKEAIASQNTVTIAVLALFIVESYFKMPVSSHPSARLSLAPQSQEDHTNICSCEVILNTQLPKASVSDKSNQR